MRKKLTSRSVAALKALHSRRILGSGAAGVRHQGEHQRLEEIFRQDARRGQTEAMRHIPALSLADARREAVAKHIFRLCVVNPKIAGIFMQGGTQAETQSLFWLVRAN
jgi:hypothetical protein